MEDLLMVALKAFPELNARGFFTVVSGVEYYFAGLQKMEVESFYKSFYEEYDVAFRVRCIFSLCDCKTESKWKRIEGLQHIYRTPILYVVKRFAIDGSPKQIWSRMVNRYNANALVIEHYVHSEYSIDYLKKFLAAKNIHVILVPVPVSVPVSVK